LTGGGGGAAEGIDPMMPQYAPRYAAGDATGDAADYTDRGGGRGQLFFFNGGDVFRNGLRLHELSGVELTGNHLHDLHRSSGRGRRWRRWWRRRRDEEAGQLRLRERVRIN